MSSVSGTTSTGVSAYGKEIAALISSDATSEEIQKVLMKGKALTNGDQILIQKAMNDSNMRVGLFTNIMKMLSDSVMNVIRNLRA